MGPTDAGSLPAILTPFWQFLCSAVVHRFKSCPRIQTIKHIAQNLLG